MTKPLWVHTPLIYSQILSEGLDCDVYLKLDNLQPSQSFKYRGMSNVAQIAKAKSANAHLIIASAGNAGFAAACAAHAVDAKCTVYLPSGLNPRFLDGLRREGANLIVGGKDYYEILLKARAAAAVDKSSIEVSAYGDPNIWQGHASMVHELSEDLNVKPDAIFCSVGGGGLLGGIVVGCQQTGWDDVPIVALETIGADCFYHSMQANRTPLLSDSPAPPFREGMTTFHDEGNGVEIVRLPSIDSVASSLGAASPAPGVVKMALQREGDVSCVLVPDGLSMQTALSFAGLDHKFLVELACSTTLVPAYRRTVFETLLPPKAEGRRRTVVFIVCGGSKISLDDMKKYQNMVELHSGPWGVWIEGKQVEIQK
ncbi:hypothetical protein M422DRAFT_39016 [Sphaerobolus stellatus SS14]|uniref:L-serine ammonia-lyase n=1 Tax=Sphaerobolus stellatus (strain SS14) TaxID=990650 RepID=A0A0C9UHU2_SPHS4|nr:hypothetical protein M422DRAFT_39016 [Sphaerobolus stellatus SS14]